MWGSGYSGQAPASSVPPAYPAVSTGFPGFPAHVNVALGHAQAPAPTVPAWTPPPATPAWPPPPSPAPSSATAPAVFAGAGAGYAPAVPDVAAHVPIEAFNIFGSAPDPFASLRVPSAERPQAPQPTAAQDTLKRHRGDASALGGSIPPSESPSESCKKMMRKMSIEGYPPGTAPPSTAPSATVSTSVVPPTPPPLMPQAATPWGVPQAAASVVPVLPIAAGAVGAGAGAASGRAGAGAGGVEEDDDVDTDLLTATGQSRVAAATRRRLGAMGPRMGAYHRHFLADDTRRRPNSTVPLGSLPDDFAWLAAAPSPPSLAIIPYPPVAPPLKLAAKYPESHGAMARPEPLRRPSASSPSSDDDGVVISTSPKIELIDSPEKEARCRGLQTVRLQASYSPPVSNVFGRVEFGDADDDDVDDDDVMGDEEL